jgi:hypothetical protein
VLRHELDVRFEMPHACLPAYTSAAKLRLLPLLVLGVAVLASAAFAADHPDITGTWLLDVAKSDLGPDPAPSDLTFTITAKGPDFTVAQSGGVRAEIVLTFNSAGKEVVNEMPGARMTSKHRWEGNTQIGELTIVAASAGHKVTMKDRISYSADGKVMTMKREMSGPTGDLQMRMVMNRK